MYFTNFQEIIIWALFIGSLIYVGRRIYRSLKPQSATGKCAACKDISKRP